MRIENLWMFLPRVVRKIQERKRFGDYNDMKLFRSFSQKSYINQSNSDHVESDHNGAGVEESVDVHDLPLSASSIPNTKAIIPGGKLNINIVRYFDVSTLSRPGEINTIANQPDAKLIERSDKPLSMVDLETDLILRFYTDKEILSKTVANSWPLSISNLPLKIRGKQFTINYQ